MKIVLIGARGFLGSALLKGLYKDEDSIEWHLFFSSTGSLQTPFNNCYYHVYKWPWHSLSDGAYEKIFADADVIIYAAGAGIQSGEDANEEIIFNLNLFEPVKLVQKLTRLNFKGQLISFGSYFEIGKDQPRGLLSEQAFLEQCNPLPNAYCRSKKELSHFHFIQDQTGIEFKWLHLVLTNIYGPGENENRLIPYIIHQSKQKKPLHFTAGSQIRQYTYVGDIVNVVGGLLGNASGLYHVTNEETVTVKTIIEEAILQVKNKLSLNPEIHYDLFERRDTAMEYLAISAQKLLRDRDLSCSTNFKEGISLYFNS